MDEITAEKILAQMRQDVEEHSQQWLAEQIGVSPSLISAVLNGTRGVSQQIAQHYGYEKVDVYRKKGP